MSQIITGFSSDDHALVDKWTSLKPFGLAARVIVDRLAGSQTTIEVFRPRTDKPLWIITVQPDGAVVLVRDTDGAMPMILWTIESALGQIVHEEGGRKAIPAKLRVPRASPVPSLQPTQPRGAEPGAAQTSKPATRRDAAALPRQ